MGHSLGEHWYHPDVRSTRCRKLKGAQISNVFATDPSPTECPVLGFLRSANFDAGSSDAHD